MQDLNDKMTGNSLTAAEWNEMPTELQNIIEAFGIVLSGADLDQVGKGIANYVGTGNAYSVGGTADVITLTTIGSKQAPTAYLNGLTVGFTPTADNTGAVTINVNALGAIDLVQADGTAMIAEDLLTGLTLGCSFRSGTNDFRVIGSSNNFTSSQVISQQIFATLGAGTWTKPAGVKFIVVEMCGGGGGGGAANVVGSAAGGGGAGYRRESIDVAAIASSGFVIGTGGAGGVGADGGTGTATSFAIASGTALGGGGGPRTSGSPSGGVGGGFTGGGPSILGIIGNGGGAGGASTGTASGVGGGSYFGGGARGKFTVAGDPGTTGGGGSGGATSGASLAGGTGGGGIIVVTEHR